MAGRGILSTARARTTLAGAGRADRFVPLREHGDEAAASGENRYDTARRNRVKRRTETFAKMEGRNGGEQRTSIRG